MTQFSRITRDPAVMSGRACLRNTHVTASTILALLAAGRSHEEVIRMLPALTPEDLHEALAYAAWQVDELAAPSALLETAPPPTPEPLPVATPEGLPHGQESVMEENSEVAATVEEIPEADEEESPEDAPEMEESLELYHPSYPDQPTVVVTRHGLFDRRWGTHTVAWGDIREIQRKSSRKTVDIILHNPEFYVSSMPFFKRLRAQIKLAFNIPTLHLDTASLGIRTKDLYHTANRLWMRHRGKLRFRKKRRMRINGKSSSLHNSSEWDRFQPM